MSAWSNIISLNSVASVNSLGISLVTQGIYIMSQACPVSGIMPGGNLVYYFKRINIGTDFSTEQLWLSPVYVQAEAFLIFCIFVKGQVHFGSLIPLHPYHLLTLDLYSTLLLFFFPPRHHLMTLFTLILASS